MTPTDANAVIPIRVRNVRQIARDAIALSAEAAPATVNLVVSVTATLASRNAVIAAKRFVTPV